MTIGINNLNHKKDSLIAKILLDVGLTLGLMLFDCFVSLPVMFMTLIMSAFNDTGYTVSSILLFPTALLLSLVPLTIIQVLFYMFAVKKVITYMVNRCLVGLGSVILVLYAYGLLSMSYAPNSLFSKLLYVF